MMIDETVASIGRLQVQTFDQLRHALRRAHAKVHGVLKGTLFVDDSLPVELKGWPLIGHKGPSCVLAEERMRLLPAFGTTQNARERVEPRPISDISD